MTTPPTDPALLARARDWAAQDPDGVTRDELRGLIADAEGGSADAAGELGARFAGRLDFGTAGLRGELGAGPARMNRVLVSQAAAGLAAFLRSREPEPSVVIGYDGRTNSDVFARDTAELMVGAGVRAILLPRLLPTPVLAFAVRHLGASAGVMVTASHNPARDNGYKVYLGGDDAGSQIVPPADAAIQAEIVRVAAGSVADLPRGRDYAIAPESLVDAYVAETAALVSTTAPLRFVYTAMHGVGWQTAQRVFAAAGFAAPVSVPEQQEPDPAFPTVAFPNPEEPGAMDLAFALAAREDVALVIANDPDADRLAVGIPDPSVAGGWRRLTGNETGALLGLRAARRVAAGGGAPGSATLACSLVSSPALGAIARAHGLRHEQTLTGFKWISRAPGLVFGFEEALGYLVDPGKVRDKDGISAAAAMLELASELALQGRTLADALVELAEQVGGYASGQLSLRVADLADIPRIMARLRSEPPSDLGGLRVLGVDDYLSGVDGFPPNDILRIRTERGGRVIVRPSGTEPKLKVYLDASSDEGSGAERLAEAQRLVDVLQGAMERLVG